MQGSVFAVMRDYLVALEHLDGQDGGKFIYCQRGVRANGEKVTDKATVIAVGETVILQVGKRKFARVTLG